MTAVTSESGFWCNSAARILPCRWFLLWTSRHWCLKSTEKHVMMVQLSSEQRKIRQVQSKFMCLSVDMWYMLQICAIVMYTEVTHLDNISLPEAQLILCCGCKVVFPCRLHDGDNSETRTRHKGSHETQQTTCQSNTAGLHTVTRLNWSSPYKNWHYSTNHMKESAHQQIYILSVT